jgi:hypothetical protein
LGTIKPVDAIEDARFAGAVGSDDGQDLPRVNVKADARESGDPSEMQFDIFDLQFAGNGFVLVKREETRMPLIL